MSEQREILFRGKRVETGEWIEGPYIQRYASGYIYLDDKHPKMVLVFRETVGQYTGLIDKNGQRIFEGDYCCITRPCVLCYGKITFANGSFWFADDGPAGMLRLSDIEPNGFRIEVRGNIHDNPKPLEGGENESKNHP